MTESTQEAFDLVQPKGDEVGNRYGKLVVLKRVKERIWGQAAWLCKCDCGNEIVASAHEVRRGRKKSCGCLTTKDETGKRYGGLTVIKQIGSNSSRQITWVCKCDCGVTTIVSGTLLRTGQKRSCGCFLKEDFQVLQGMPEGEAAFNKLYRDLKRSAAKRNKLWALSEEEVRTLTSQHCYYCGAEPSQFAIKNNNGSYQYNGLDRIDNALGYTVDNVVPCCGFCNRARGSKTQREFLEWFLGSYKRILEGRTGKAVEKLMAYANKD